mmetsp:Transcript_5572/g.9613  ORF Transcript_5572/g.9613 Transcript_5572/m.9613 type:complete len:178 (+) Transcript_5572:3-536(+)
MGGGKGPAFRKTMRSMRARGTDGRLLSNSNSNSNDSQNYSRGSDGGEGSATFEWENEWETFLSSSGDWAKDNEAGGRSRKSRKWVPGGSDQISAALANGGASRDHSNAAAAGRHKNAVRVDRPALGRGLGFSCALVAPRGRLVVLKGTSLGARQQIAGAGGRATVAALAGRMRCCFA